MLSLAIGRKGKQTTFSGCGTLGKSQSSANAHTHVQEVRVATRRSSKGELADVTFLLNIVLRRIVKSQQTYVIHIVTCTFSIVGWIGRGGKCSSPSSLPRDTQKKLKTKHLVKEPTF